jgi:hypothetical protein
MTERFDGYGDVLTRLVTVAIACSPESWDRGRLSITCDGSRIDYSLKNDGSAERARISDELRSLCEELYVVMRNAGDDWSEAVVLYHRKDDDTWGMETSFTYPDGVEDVDDGAAPEPAVPAAPWWKSLLRRMAPAPPWSREPRLLVAEFIREFQRWNDRANDDASARPDEETDWKAIDAEWMDRVIGRFCRPGFRAGPIAFGSDSRHHPEREEILSADVSGDRATVKTRAAVPILADRYNQYEYELTRDGGRWYLEQLFYVDEEGRWPEL